MQVESFADIPHDSLYKNIMYTTYEHEINCAYRFVGRIKHTTCSFEYSHKFLRYGHSKFQSFGGRGSFDPFSLHWSCSPSTSRRITSGGGATPMHTK